MWHSLSMAFVVQGAQLSEDLHADAEVQEAKLSADMAARVAAVTALSQLAQLASQQRQLPDQPSAHPDASQAGTYLPAFLACTSQAFSLWHAPSLASDEDRRPQLW